MRFSGNCSTGATRSYAGSCEEQAVVFEHDVAQAHAWGTCPAVAERDVSRKVISRVEFMAFSVAGSTSDALSPHPLGTENVYAVSPKTIEGSRGETSSSCDKGRCQYITACSRECRAAHCRLPWHGRRQLRKPAVTTRRPWSDSLISCGILRWRVSWELNVVRHTLYNTFHFFKQWITIWTACTRISFHSQMHKIL
jgi:hypothetical protein